ncbi:MAG: YggS family pyridoxal phosphate-dependent enzyme [Elusimicrobiota bacterium]|jgi:hypothetical protein
MRLQDQISEQIARVQSRLEAAAKRSGRSSKEITLVAVTKTVPFEQVLPFLQAGIGHIGENRVQEAGAKYRNPDGSKRVEAALHLIGPLQTNKAKKAAEFFDLIQTLDRMELAEDLDRHAKALGRQVPCLVEVKISTESTKHGLSPEKVVDFISEVQSRTALQVKGLMGIAPLTKAAEEARPYFAALRKLFEKTHLDILSMGMSSDFEVAIEEGSTMIRVGTALFGARA